MVKVPKTSAGGTKWLLLIHSLPPKPDYLRVKVRRRLHKMGAVAVKSTVYVLPKNEQSLEDFRWLVEEIRRDNGEGVVCEADFVEGLSDGEVMGLFNKERDAAYNAISAQGRELLKQFRSPKLNDEKRVRLANELTRLRHSVDEIAELDFFEAEACELALDVIAQVEDAMALKAKQVTKQSSRKISFSARTWVTRSNVFVDRMASAWLIKRFIDPKARFRFVDPKKYSHSKNELRFDMFEGEFTHRGDQCTFEVLLTTAAINDRGLAELAEIVHDIDLKDNKFGRVEAAGIALALRGVRTRRQRDEERVADSQVFFDGLYEELRKNKRK